MVGSTGLTILETGFSQYIHNNNMDIYIYIMIIIILIIIT